MGWLMKCGKANIFLALVATASLSFGSLQQTDPVSLNNRSVDRASPRLKWHAPKIPELTQFVERDGEVWVMRHANGETGRSCRTNIPTRGLRDETDEGKFIVADCATFPGMSGAPVLAKVDDQARLIGFNIGRRWGLSLGEPEWHRAVNVIRLLDDEIVRAIQKATQRVRHNY